MSVENIERHVDLNATEGAITIRLEGQLVGLGPVSGTAEVTL